MKYSCISRHLSLKIKQGKFDESDICGISISQSNSMDSRKFEPVYNLALNMLATATASFLNDQKLFPLKAQVVCKILTSVHACQI